MLKMGKGQISVNDSHLSLTLDALTHTHTVGAKLRNSPMEMLVSDS